MDKNYMKFASNEELMVEYIRSQMALSSNYVLGRGTKWLTKHCADLEGHLLSRGLLTQHMIDQINA